MFEILNQNEQEANCTYLTFDVTYMKELQQINSPILASECT